QVGVYRSYIYGESWKMDVHQDYLYLNLYNGLDIEILNISNPLSPELVGFYSSSNPINNNYVKNPKFIGVLVYEEYLFAYEQRDYFSNPQGYLHILDIKNPASPQLITRIANGGEPVAASSEYLFTDLNGNLEILRGLKVYNISDFDQPVLFYEDPSIWSIMDVEIVGDIAFVGFQGLHIWDISNPTGFIELSKSKRLPNCYKIIIDGKYAYVGTSHGVYVFDVSNLEDPKLVVKSWDLQAKDMYLQDGYLYVVGYGGLYVFKALD
ncbi:LVIVD repeat-containing protein, partial [Chloroflexota bacterium]